MFKLEKGDKIGIVSPSSFLNGPENIENGLKFMVERGFIPVLGKHVFDRERYMAGSPAHRAEDLMDFYKDPEIKAIFCTRGGAGSQYILSYLDYETIKQNPKPLFGFSDSTALQLAIYAKTQNISYTGFLLGFSFKTGQITPRTKETFDTITAGKKTTLTAGKTMIAGKTKGVLIGGNLSLLRNLCGTEYFPDLTDKILLIEDVNEKTYVGEKTYKIDLMLLQLSQNKNFSKVKGIIFGEFENSILTDREDGTTDEIIEYFCKNLNIPVLKSFPHAHNSESYILPLGKEISLDATNCQIEF